MPKNRKVGGRLRTVAFAVIATALTLSAASVRAQETGRKDFIQAEFWIDLAPVSKVGDPWPVSPEEGAGRLLDETRETVQGGRAA